MGRSAGQRALPFGILAGGSATCTSALCPLCGHKQHYIKYMVLRLFFKRPEIFLYQPILHSLYLRCSPGWHALRHAQPGAILIPETEG